MLELERTTVSRKTPRDGRLEILAATGAELRRAGNALRVDVDGAKAPGFVETMPCGCAKASAGHAHTFLKADILKALRPDSTVRISLDTVATPSTVYITAAD